MARNFRFWVKKRGERRTGSRWVGGVGEALFFGLLFFLGAISTAYLTVFHLIDPDFFPSGTGMWLLMLVCGSFMAIGGGGAVYSLIQLGTSAERRSALAKQASKIELIRDALPEPQAYPSIPRDTNLTNSPGIRLAYRLPMSHTQAWQLLAASAFCLVWNVMSVVLVSMVARSHLKQEPDWFLTLFVVPFLGIGIWAIYYFFQQVLLHTGMGPTSVEISDHPLRPGTSYDMYLSQGGRMQLKRLELSLVCDEEATFQQGTDIRTETFRVFKQVIFAKEDFRIETGKPFEQQVQFSIPPFAMHSFQGNHNSIHWKLEIRGQAKSWPVFERVFPIVVYPPGAEGDLE